MEIPRHWRMKKIRLGNSEEWRKIVSRYRDERLNPHLSLALLASDLPMSALVEIHDRGKEVGTQEIIYERKNDP